MKWDNLKMNACPLCTGKLEDIGAAYICSHSASTMHQPCGFRISKAKFDELITKMYQPKPKRKCAFEDNFERLQNYEKDPSQNIWPSDE